MQLPLGKLESTHGVPPVQSRWYTMTDPATSVARSSAVEITMPIRAIG